MTRYSRITCVVAYAALLLAQSAAISFGSPRQEPAGAGISTLTNVVITDEETWEWGTITAKPKVGTLTLVNKCDVKREVAISLDGPLAEARALLHVSSKVRATISRDTDMYSSYESIWVVDLPAKSSHAVIFEMTTLDNVAHPLLRDRHEEAQRKAGRPDFLGVLEVEHEEVSTCLGKVTQYTLLGTIAGGE